MAGPSRSRRPTTQGVSWASSSDPWISWRFGLPTSTACSGRRCRTIPPRPDVPPFPFTTAATRSSRQTTAGSGSSRALHPGLARRAGCSARRGSSANEESMTKPIRRGGLLPESGARRKGAVWTSYGLVASPGTRSGLVDLPSRAAVRQWASRPPTPLAVRPHTGGPTCSPMVVTLSRLRQIEVALVTFDDGDIAVVDIERGGAPEVVWTGGYYPRYSPSGHIVYARHGSLMAVPFDAETPCRHWPRRGGAPRRDDVAGERYRSVRDRSATAHSCTFLGAPATSRRSSCGPPRTEPRKPSTFPPATTPTPVSPPTPRASPSW